MSKISEGQVWGYMAESRQILSGLILDVNELDSQLYNGDPLYLCWVYNLSDSVVAHWYIAVSDHSPWKQLYNDAY